jgi:hypothetical protein
MSILLAATFLLMATKSEVCLKVQKAWTRVWRVSLLSIDSGKSSRVLSNKSSRISKNASFKVQVVKIFPQVSDTADPEIWPMDLLKSRRRSKDSWTFMPEEVTYTKGRRWAQSPVSPLIFPRRAITTYSLPPAPHFRRASLRGQAKGLHILWVKPHSRQVHMNGTLSSNWGPLVKEP